MPYDHRDRDPQQPTRQSDSVRIRAVFAQSRAVLGVLPVNSLYGEEISRAPGARLSKRPMISCASQYGNSNSEMNSSVSCRGGSFGPPPRATTRARGRTAMRTTAVNGAKTRTARRSSATTGVKVRTAGARLRTGVRNLDRAGARLDKAWRGFARLLAQFPRHRRLCVPAAARCAPRCGNLTDHLHDAHAGAEI
jgi:hypothetical protein